MQSQMVSGEQTHQVLLNFYAPLAFLDPPHSLPTARCEMTQYIQLHNHDHCHTPYPLPLRLPHCFLFLPGRLCAKRPGTRGSMNALCRLYKLIELGMPCLSALLAFPTHCTLDEHHLAAAPVPRFQLLNEGQDVARLMIRHAR